MRFSLVVLVGPLCEEFRQQLGDPIGPVDEDKVVRVRYEFDAGSRQLVPESVRHQWAVVESLCFSNYDQDGKVIAASRSMLQRVGFASLMRVRKPLTPVTNCSTTGCHGSRRSRSAVEGMAIESTNAESRSLPF